MKRILLMAVIGAVVLLARVEPSGRNISTLRPVHVLIVSQEQGQIRLRTDSGEDAVGDSVSAALEKMYANAPGGVFLDTADYLLVSDTAVLEAVKSHLRPSCRVCIYEGEPDLEALGDYLKHHTPGVSIKDWNADRKKLPVLRTQEGRMELAD